jgi:hypothetical protein
MSVAFPFVEVRVDTSGLRPVAQRAAGVLAIVGVSASGNADPNEPVEITALADIEESFGDDSELGRSLAMALAQDPAPDTIYGVKVAEGKVEDGLAALEAADDVTFVALASTFATKADAGDPVNPDLVALKTHCESMSRAGNKRIGVAAIDPGMTRESDYLEKVEALSANLRSDISRMILVAARAAQTPAGESADVAVAAAAAIAALPVTASIVLKPIAGFSIPVSQQYAPKEIDALSKLGIIPIIDPALVVGESLHFAEGTTFTKNPELRYVDTVRLLDAVEFSLKATLIGLIADARITRSGLRFIVQRAGGVLDRYLLTGAIDSWHIEIPVLTALEVPEATRPQVMKDLIAEARTERHVPMNIEVVLGPAIHRLSITLRPNFA